MCVCVCVCAMAKEGLRWRIEQMVDCIIYFGQVSMCSVKSSLPAYVHGGKFVNKLLMSHAIALTCRSTLKNMIEFEDLAHWY